MDAVALPPPSSREIFLAFLRLGCTSFGGPVAHLGYFHGEFVRRRCWVSEEAYADLVALCQLLPGPASSQVGMALGYTWAGIGGLLAAWVGFTLPSALLMIGFAGGVGFLGGKEHAGWLHGLKLAAVAIVAQAVWAMATKLCPDRARRTLALLAAGTMLACPVAGAQIVVIAAGAVAGLMLGRMPDGAEKDSEVSRGQMLIGGGLPRTVWVASMALGTFAALFVGLPLAVAAWPQLAALRVFEEFYRAGALVFGGGHVVLPLLQARAVEPGWITVDRFLAGYGAAQALPGPLFAFAGYLGASLAPPWSHGWTTGLLSLAAIYLPSMLLVVGVLPSWETLRRSHAIRAALRGANATVVGVLLAALYQPVWTDTVHTARDFLVALVGYGLLTVWRCPPWTVVPLAAAAGQLWLGGG